MGLLSRVMRVDLSGTISDKFANQVSLRLLSKSLFRYTGLVVVINSQYCAEGSAKQLYSAIKHFQNAHEVPVFAFASDFTLGWTNLLLYSGQKCYASKYSVLGYKLGSKRLVAGPDAENITGIKFKTTSDTHVPRRLIVESQKQMIPQLQTKIEQQQARLTEKLSSFRKIGKELDVIDGEQALKLNLVDDLLTPQQLLKSRFEGVRVTVVQNENRRFRANFELSPQQC